jgi:hypothetical protein
MTENQFSIVNKFASRAQEAEETAIRDYCEWFLIASGVRPPEDVDGGRPEASVRAAWEMQIQQKYEEIDVTYRALLQVSAAAF